MKAGRRKAKTEIAFTPGVCVDEPGPMARMMEKTQQSLILMTGRLRTTTVTWRHIRGPENAAEFLAAAYGTDLDDETRQVVHNYLAFLDRHGDRGMLVVAECEVSVR